MPAGMEMRLRKIGIIRPKKTALTPCRRNQASVRSTSASFTATCPGTRTPCAPRLRLNRVVPLPGLAAQPCVGAYAQVVRPGRVRLGDPVRLA